MAKLNPQIKAAATQIVAALASSIAERGVMPSDKSIRNSCLTAIRVATQLEVVSKIVEENDSLLTLPVEESHIELGQIVAKAAAQPQAVPAETADTEPKV